MFDSWKRLLGVGRSELRYTSSRRMQEEGGEVRLLLIAPPAPVLSDCPTFVEKPSPCPNDWCTEPRYILPGWTTATGSARQ